MTATRYWNSTSGQWVLIGGMSAMLNVLPVAGGKMHGPLRVTGNLSTMGVVHADFYSNPDPNAFLNASVGLVGRTVRFGGNPVKRVGPPTAAGDLATNTYLNTTSTTSTRKHIFPLYLHWVSGTDDGRGPLTVYRSSDGLVSFQGAVRSRITMRPKPGSTPIGVLPEGMRPSTAKLFPVFGDGAVYRCEVRPDGNILLVGGRTGIHADNWIVLSGICFYCS